MATSAPQNKEKVSAGTREVIEENQIALTALRDSDLPAAKIADALLAAVGQ